MTEINKDTYSLIHSALYGAFRAGTKHAGLTDPETLRAFESWFKDTPKPAEPVCKHDGDWHDDGVSFTCERCGAYLGEKT